MLIYLRMVKEPVDIQAFNFVFIIYSMKIFEMLWFCRKQILSEIASNSDLTSEKFRECHRRICLNIDSIKPVDEYKDFTEKYK